MTPDGRAEARLPLSGPKRLQPGFRAPLSPLVLLDQDPGQGAESPGDASLPLSATASEWESGTGMNTEVLVASPACELQLAARPTVAHTGGYLSTRGRAGLTPEGELGRVPLRVA